MSVQSQSSKTVKFIDLFFHLIWASAGVMFLALIFSSSFSKTLVSTQIQVEPEDSVTLDPIELKSQTIGALRVDVRAYVPSNQWVTYEIQLRDQQGEIIASGLKQAWAESGTWSEEGETGSWYEDDVNGGLDVRATETEPVTIAVEVLEYSDTSGIELTGPVTFAVDVKQGVIDSRYLWAGFVGTAILALISFFAVPTGKEVIKQVTRHRSEEVEASGRAMLGGKNRLVKAAVRIETDHNCPPTLHVELTVCDGNGTEIHRQSESIAMVKHKNDKGQVLSGSGNLQSFFILDPKDSYKFQIQTNSKRVVRKTDLRVFDGGKTVWPVQVTHLTSTIA